MASSGAAQVTDSKGFSKNGSQAVRALLLLGARNAHNGASLGGGTAVPDVYLRTLVRAAQIVGGEQALALHLKVTPSHLALWLKGLEEPTTEAFLRAVDLVSAHQLAQLPQPPPPRPQPGTD